MGEMKPSAHDVISQVVGDHDCPLSGQIDEQTFHPHWSSKGESKRGINRQHCLRLDQKRKELDCYDYPPERFDLCIHVYRDMDIESGDYRYKNDSFRLFIEQAPDSMNYYEMVEFVRLKLLKFSLKIHARTGVMIPVDKYYEALELGEVGIKEPTYFVHIVSPQWMDESKRGRKARGER